MDDVKWNKARGWLRDDERAKLHDLAKAVPPFGTMVNIGIEYGASMVCLRAGACYDAILIGIDVDNSLIPVDVLAWLKKHPVTLIEDFSYNVFQAMRTLIKDVDLVFVDGDHAYEGVQLDCHWAELVRVGGTIVFHDCWAWSDNKVAATDAWVAGVNKAVQEWHDSHPEWEELVSVSTMRIFQRVA